MARRPKNAKKSLRIQLEKAYKKCKHCNDQVHAQGFKKHVDWCKEIAQVRKELRQKSHRSRSQLATSAVPSQSNNATASACPEELSSTSAGPGPDLLVYEPNTTVSEGSEANDAAETPSYVNTTASLPSVGVYYSNNNLNDSSDN